MLDVATNASYCFGINGIYSGLSSFIVNFETLLNVNDTYAQPFRHVDVECVMYL